MNLFKLSYKNILSKPLNAFLSLVLLALSAGLISMSLHLQENFAERTQKNTGGIDMVVGAKGSPLQLILSSVLHIDNPTGNINYAEAQKIGKHPLVERAIPISYGDNYKGYRIVGTTPEFIKLYEATINEGKLFENVLEVVLGANVAAVTGVQINDEIIGSHGLIEDAIEAHDDHKLRVVGIFGATNSVLDNLIITPLETVWAVHDDHDHAHEDEHDTHTHHHEHVDDHQHHNHDDAHHHHDHADHHHDHDEEASGHHLDHEDETREITALLVKFRSPMGFMQLPRNINTDTNMQAALIRYEMERLYNFTGIGVKIIRVIAIVILIISVFSIFISLYRIVRDRRYELALMRVYGASRSQIITVVFIEGLIIGVLGFILGILMSRLGIFVLYKYLDTEFKFTLSGQFFNLFEIYILLAILALLVIAAAFAVIPLFKLNVSKILTNEK
jgi:putative ABC transport system permease protein